MNNENRNGAQMPQNEAVQQPTFEQPMQQPQMPQQSQAGFAGQPYTGQPQTAYAQQPYGTGVPPYAAGPMPYMNYPQPVAKQETEQTKNLKSNFRTLSIACFIYACFYALCMYKNGSGITYPFFLAGSLWFYCYCMKKLGVSSKRGSIFYMISILLLGISTFLTADPRIIFFNKTGIWLLTIGFLLHRFYQVHNWTFGRYLGYMVCTVFGSLGEIHRPFTDFAGYRKTKTHKSGGVGGYVIIGLCFSIPLFFIVFALLTSADMVFSKMTEGFFKDFGFGDVFGVMFTIIFMFLGAYWIMAHLCKKTFSEEAKERKRMEAIVGIVITLPVTVLYLVFSVIQIYCLFMGNVNLEGYTYAEYAREGFFQLLAVCMINLILVLISHAYFKNSGVLKLIMTVMSLCTYVMIASSAYRMILYIKNYYLTFLRILVLWSLAVIAILLTGVILSIFFKKFKLFKYSMVVVTFCYLVLSFSHPDYWIARCNVANMGSSSSDFFEADSYDDYGYLAGLSEDAAPAFAELFAEEGFDMETVKEMVPRVEESQEKYYYYSDEYLTYSDVFDGNSWDENAWGYYYLKEVFLSYEDMSFRSFNLSKYIAYQVFQ